MPTESTSNIDVNEADIASGDNSQGQLADFGADQPDPTDPNDQSDFQFTNLESAPEGFIYTTSQDNDGNEVLTVQQVNEDGTTNNWNENED